MVNRQAPHAVPRPQKRGLGVLLLLLLALAWYVPRAGAMLVAEDAFDHVDLAVVLSGVPFSRALAARDLYQQGRVTTIVIIPEPKDQTWREMVALRLEDPAHPMSERILTASGVPRSHILFLPEAVDGTIQEARAVRAFLQGRMPRRLVIITSMSASRRARMIFRSVLGPDGVEVLSSPTPYEPFEPQAWWRSPRNTLTVVMEHQKFLVNAAALALDRLRSTFRQKAVPAAAPL